MMNLLHRIRRQFVPERSSPRIGIVLSGGGARASYQAGVLRFIADTVPDAFLPVVTGVSAGAINAALIANHCGSFQAATDDLVTSWESLTSEDVYEAAGALEFFWTALRKVGTDDIEEIPRHGLVQTDPMREFLKGRLSAPDGNLTGISENIRAGRLEACAFLGTNYGTGQTVAWVDGTDLRGWDRAHRKSFHGPLLVEHIMASSSLPFLFPAIQVGDAWFGDGGIRLAEPLSPAIHLGANRILAISTRHGRSEPEASDPVVTGYPPAAQVFGMLLNAIFLDRLDQDAHLLARINDLISDLPVRRRRDLNIIDLLVIRPSVDLGKLAGEYQMELTGSLSLLAKVLGSSDTKSPDWLSMMLFDPGYASRLLEIGYQDAKREREEIAYFFDRADR